MAGTRTGPYNCGKGQTVMCQAPKWYFLDIGAMQEERYNCRGCSSSRRAVGTGWKMGLVQCFSLGCVNRDRQQGSHRGWTPQKTLMWGPRRTTEEPRKSWKKDRMGRKPRGLQSPHMSLCRAGTGGHKVARRRLAQPHRLRSGGLCPRAPTNGCGTI